MTSSPQEGCSERASSMDTASPMKAARGPWRSVGASVMSAGVPTAVGIVHPFIGVGMAIVELVVALAVVGTALFGSLELSERAFRLLRWIANRAEPLAPPRVLKIAEMPSTAAWERNTKKPRSPSSSVPPRLRRAPRQLRPALSGSARKRTPGARSEASN